MTDPRRAEVLLEALPYIREFRGKTVVIKYGGAAMERADLKEPFALDVILLRFVGIKPVIVHGGGPQIGALMKRLGMEPRFVGGMRVTDEETVEIVEMVLVGKINKAIVGLINHHGGKAVGLSGKDAGLLRARRRPHRLAHGEAVDIGLVGEGEAVNTAPIRLLAAAGCIPVIARGGDRVGVCWSCSRATPSSARSSSRAGCTPWTTESWWSGRRTAPARAPRGLRSASCAVPAAAAGTPAARSTATWARGWRSPRS